MVRDAARAIDVRADDVAVQCAMAKRFATDAGFEVANRALQLHGGYGYLQEYGIEKVVRDLRASDPGGHERDHAGHHRSRRSGSMST
jgi:alkylation response protein AidB-like acyl-CoA dehydrogenase